MQRKVLNVGGNSKAIAIPKHYDGWIHHLLDIDPTGKPDIVCDARLLEQIMGDEYESIYCSHNLEHYYSHDVLRVLRGFRHILKDDGFTHIRVPDIQALMQHVVQNNMDINDFLYQSPSGPIAVKDVIYGFGKQIEHSGQDFYAHKTGFSVKSLLAVLKECGFPITYYSVGDFEISVFAFKQRPTEYATKLLNLPPINPVKTEPKAAVTPEQNQRLIEKEHRDFAQKRFPGINYLDWLIWMHHTLKPSNYVEIGVETGQSLQFVQNPTKAIGIDPAMQIDYSQETWVKLFKLSSDDFFAQYDLRTVLGEEFVELAFIDGMHTFEQTLKDFIAIERYAKPETLVVLHDTFPVIPITACRERQSIFWLGDTWKIVPILRELRPDLKIFTIPTFPSGLTLVTGLNNKSTLLSDKLAEIVAQWMDVALDSYIDTLDVHLNVVENDYLVVSKLLK